MVKSVTQGDKRYYLCSVCGLTYAEVEWAERCEDFCTRYKGCSMEITSHAVPLDETGEGSKP